VRIIASEGPAVFVMYRRHTKTLGYLGGIDTLYGDLRLIGFWGVGNSIERRRNLGDELVAQS
jgi:hypothetical protein